MLWAFVGVHQEAKGVGRSRLYSGERCFGVQVSRELVHKEQIKARFVGQGQRLRSAPGGSGTVAFALQ